MSGTDAGLHLRLLPLTTLHLSDLAECEVIDFDFTPEVIERWGLTEAHLDDSDWDDRGDAVDAPDAPLPEP